MRLTTIVTARRAIDMELLCGVPRGAGWGSLQRQLRVEWPTCAACGQPTKAIHHIKPYHLYPEFELVRMNLIALCFECHFRLGHGCNWKAYVPNTRELAAQLLAARVARQFKRLT